MFKYNHNISRTANAKAFIGETVRFTSKPKPFGPTFTYEGKVVSVKGLNGECAQVTFENGKFTYYTWGVSAEIL